MLALSLLVLGTLSSSRHLSEVIIATVLKVNTTVVEDSWLSYALMYISCTHVTSTLVALLSAESDAHMHGIKLHEKVYIIPCPAASIVKTAARSWVAIGDCERIHARQGSPRRRNVVCLGKQQGCHVQPRPGKVCRFGHDSRVVVTSQKSTK